MVRVLDSLQGNWGPDVCRQSNRRGESMKELFVYIASAYSIGDKLTNVKKSLEVANALMNKALFRTLHY